MKKHMILFSICIIFSTAKLFSQATNIYSTNPLAEQIMLGNYNPATYAASQKITFPDSITKGLLQRVNADTLKKYIIKLASFKNRNAGSDTLSTIHGIGATRRWIYSKFQEYSLANENRLIPSYLQFTQTICLKTSHRNVFAVLPGTDTTDKNIVIIEGHMDSRCEGSCDSLCIAQGVEDNATGTALVMELARVMSKYSFKNTIVFIATTSEEQSLNGARAFATYIQNKGIKVKAVQNNDVIGGVICGQTSSPPSCPGLNDIDSLQVRLFSAGGFNSPHKQYARFSKLEYNEELLPIVPVKMTVSIMSAEDRTGRGGDHIPFRERGYTAIRYTSANEHGDAGSTAIGYTDRQHSTRDTLGIDTNSDMVIDSFYIDFNYLARNAVLNGNTLTMAAIGPETPNFTATIVGTNKIAVQITQQTNYATYRFADRTTTNDWDSVYTFNKLIDTITVSSTKTHYVSVAAVDSNGVESLFSKEIIISLPIGIDEITKREGITLMQNQPNPFDESTIIAVYVEQRKKYKAAAISITDITGKLVKTIPIELKTGMNEVVYEHGYAQTGIFIYNLIIDGQTVQSRKMVFAN